MKLNSAESGTSSPEAMLKASPIVPVVTITSADRAVDLAEALAAGGMSVVEVTLRTADALQAIEQIKQKAGNVLVGAGTVLNAEDVRKSVDAGADFLVSPGSTDALLDAGIQSGLPLLPGVANASDVMRCLDHGLDILKFFPAEATGGIKLISALHGPFSGVRFCPTGGVNPDNLASYLGNPAVISVGGTWIAPKKDIAEGNWSTITARAAEASATAGKTTQPE